MSIDFVWFKQSSSLVLAQTEVDGLDLVRVA